MAVRVYGISMMKDREYLGLVELAFKNRDKATAAVI